MIFKISLVLSLEAKLETSLLCWLHESVEIIAWLSKNVADLVVAEEIDRLKSTLLALLQHIRIQVPIHLLLEANFLLLLSVFIEEYVLIV